MCNLYCSLFLLILMIIYWVKVAFSSQLLVLGLISGATEVAGKSLAQNAIRIGPCGPAVAIVTMCSVYLVIVEAIMTLRTPTIIEFVGLVCSVIGSLVLCVPEYFIMAYEKVFRRGKTQESKVPLAQE